MKHILSSLFVCVTVLFVGACQTMTPADEKRIGLQEHPKIIQQHNGAYEYGDLNHYIAQIGFKLVKNSEMPNENFTFTVLNDKMVNAFALPGGFVYITRGLIAVAENEAEIAGVLAHEIAHVTARHTAQRMGQAQTGGLLVFGAAVLDAAVGGGGLIGQAASVGAQGYLAGFSRDQELEADMLGLKYMTAAGYDPNALKTFFEKMEDSRKLDAKIAGKEGQDPYNFLSTHPRTSERIDQAMKLAKPRPDRNPRVARAQFLNTINGIIYGDDIAQGVIEDRRFSHPELGITYQVPEGFRLINSPAQVTATDNNGALIVFDMEDPKKAPSYSDLTSYISAVWSPNLKVINLERIRINSMEAATGITRMRTNQGERDLRLLAIRGGQDRLYRFIFVTPPDRTQALAKDLQRATYSFRKLTLKEIEAIKPYRIKLVKVGRGETTSKLAKKMEGEAYPEDRFMAINRLAVQDGLQAGEKVKIIRND